MKAALLVIGVLISLVLLLNTHMVRTREGVALLWKERMALKETWVDVRETGVTGYLDLPKPVRDFLVQQQYQQLRQNLPGGGWQSGPR